MRADRCLTGPFLTRGSYKHRSRRLAFEECEDRNLLTVAVSSIGLSTDSGVSSSDHITNAPAITGWTTGSPPAYGHADIQFDYFCNGTTDASVTLSGSYFYYDPLYSLGLGTWQGSLAMQYRVVEYNSNGSVASTGNWNTFNIVLDRLAPSGYVSSLSVNENSPDSQIDLNAAFSDGYSSDANLQYQIVNNSNYAMFDSVAISNGTLTLNYAANHFGNAALTVRCTDQAGNTYDSVLNVNVNRVNDPPTITGFTVTKLEDNNWRLSGTVTDDVSLTGCYVYFGGIFAGHNFTATIGTNGEFSVTVNCPMTFGGTATAIAHDSDQVASNEATYTVNL